MPTKKNAKSIAKGIRKERVRVKKRSQKKKAKEEKKLKEEKGLTNRKSMLSLTYEQSFI